MGPSVQKRLRSEPNSQEQQPPPNNAFDSTTSLSQHQINERKATQGGRCRLFIGNVPSDLTQDEFQILFGKYGELVEYFVNPSRGFGFIKLVCFLSFKFKQTKNIFFDHLDFSTIS